VRSAGLDPEDRPALIGGLKIIFHHAFDDDLVFGDILSGGKEDDVRVAERTDALTDATGAAGANDNVETERHVRGGLDLVAALERHEVPRQSLRLDIPVREADDRDDRLRMLLVCGLELDGIGAAGPVRMRVNDPAVSILLHEPVMSALDVMGCVNVCLWLEGHG
jgi:hypothetical protein